MKEIEAIRSALAAGPTPGPWKAHCYVKACHYEDEEADGYVIEGATYESDYENPMLCKADAQFIASVNPEAMTAVLAHIEEQDTELAAYETAIAEYRQQCLDNHAAVQMAEARHAQELAAYELTVQNQRTELTQRGKIVAWGMPRPDGTIIDAIDPDEHERKEGSYTVPLYTAQQAPHTEAEVQELMEFARHYAANTFSSETLEDKFRRILGVPKP